jgi:hypothetical protein
MKVATIFGGPYRGNPTNMENHLKIIGSYDTYVSCLEHYEQDWLNSGWPIKKIFITPPINFNTTNWSKYRNDAAGQSGFWQFWNLKNVIKNIDEDYDFYIKSRTDLDFSNGCLDESFFTTILPNTLYCPFEYFDAQVWDIDKLLNDQFYIGDSNVMNTISEFPTEYYNKERHALNQDIASNERNLRNWLNENNINVSVIKDIKYTKNHNGITQLSGISGFQLEQI